MTRDPVIRAWKDPRYRRSLGAAQLAALPAHPAGSATMAARQIEGKQKGGPPVSDRLFTYIAMTVNTCC